MPDRFDVVPHQLRSTGDDVSNLSADLDRSLERLRAGLARLGEPWGGDEPGRAFAGRHLCDRGVLHGHLEALVVGLGSIGDGLRRMAERYESSDDASTIGGR